MTPTPPPDLMSPPVEEMTAHQARVHILALRGVVRLLRVELAEKERDIVRWMRETVSYRGTLADIRRDEAVRESRGAA